MSKNVLIYIEHNNNSIEKVSKEIISNAVSSFNDVELTGLILCDDKGLLNLEDELRDLPLSRVIIFKDNIFDCFNTCIFSDVVSNYISDTIPDVFLIGATENGRDLAPRIAAKLNIGLTADCTSLELDENGDLLATRPTYGGKMMATIVSKTLPNFATVRPGAFKLNTEYFKNNNPDISLRDANLSGIKTLLEVLSYETKVKTEDWACAEIIVAGGLGLGSKENFELIYKLSDKIGAKPAASRAAVEQGWAQNTIQVGQTGTSVSPKLYIAFGISGAMQHMVGITNSDRIIAVNTDKTAPIMKAADVAVINDAVSVLKELITK